MFSNKTEIPLSEPTPKNHWRPRTFPIRVPLPALILARRAVHRIIDPIFIYVNSSSTVSVQSDFFLLVYALQPQEVAGKEPGSCRGAASVAFLGIHGSPAESALLARRRLIFFLNGQEHIP
jgi:hypothetical protein